MANRRPARARSFDVHRWIAPLLVAGWGCGPQQFIEVPGSNVRIELGPGSTYRVSLDPEYRLRRTSYDLLVKRGRFDPLTGTPPAPAGVDSSADGRLYLVQFFTPPLAEYRAHLATLGARAVTFFPHNAHIVEMNAAAAIEVARQPYVRWVGPYRPSYRLPPELAARLDGDGPALGSARYNIQVAQPARASRQRVADQLRRLGARIDSLPARGLLVSATLDAEQLAAATRLDDVLHIDPWSPPQPDIDIARAISGADHVDTVAGFTGDGVRGEVMDGNVLETHGDFQSRPLLLHGPREGDSFHGTSTTGIVFGDGAGDPRARGVLPSGQGIFGSYETLDDRHAHTAELLAEPYFAVFQSNSWGGDLTTEYTTVSADMDAMLFELDLVLFQSQSNTGSQLSRPEAWAKNIVSVGGVLHHDTLDTSDDEWDFSASIGPAEDGRIKPDLSHFWDFTLAPTGDGGYDDEFGGTSGATPITAGHAGLFFQMWAAGLFGNTPSGPSVFEARPHMTTTKAVLINTAAAYEFSGANSDLTRAHQGWGRVDIRRLYELRNQLYVVDESDVLPLFGVARHELTVDDGQPELRATLVFADPPGVPGAAQARVNDLTLRVISPSGTAYFGNNGLVDGNVSTPGGDANTLDTVENVIVVQPEPGQWTVEVHADEINEDGHRETPELDADYALAVSGVRTGVVPGPGHVVVVGVGYDTPGVDSIEEYVELHNPTRTAFDLGGWILEDDVAAWTIPAGTVIAPGGQLTISRDGNGFRNRFGKTAHVTGLSLGLGNDGDRLRLVDSAGREVDFVAWEGFAAGWTISAATGTSIVRAPGTDTDSAADWRVQSPSDPHGAD